MIFLRLFNSGDVSLLDVRMIPFNESAVQVTLVIQGLAPVNGVIRPSYSGYPATVTYPINVTANQVCALVISIGLLVNIAADYLSFHDGQNNVLSEPFSKA